LPIQSKHNVLGSASPSRPYASSLNKTATTKTLVSIFLSSTPSCFSKPNSTRHTNNYPVPVNEEETEKRLTTNPGSLANASGVAKLVASWFLHIPPAPLKVSNPLAALNPAPHSAKILLEPISTSPNSSTSELGPKEDLGTERDILRVKLKINFRELM
jgi:hypothetical protein